MEMTTIETALLWYAIASVAITVMVDSHARSNGRDLSVGLYIMLLLIGPIMFPISLVTAIVAAWRKR